MNENAGSDDPGGGVFYPVMDKEISLMEHEEFEKSQSELQWSTKMVKRNRSRRARERERNHNKNGDLSRSRSRDASTTSSTRVSELLEVNERLTDTPLQLGQHSCDQQQASTPSSPPAYLITDPPTDLTQTPASPFTPVGRERYTDRDQGPFVVHVQKVETAADSGVILHPISFGLFLQKRFREFPNVVEGSIKRIGRNRVAVSFYSADDANSFLSSPALTQQKYRAFVPSFNVTRLGLVRGVPSNWSPEEVLELIQVPENSGGARPVKIRRLNYKKNNTDGTYCWLPSETIVITFDGQILPNRIFMCFNSLPVEQYKLPTIQCFRCCRFGHTKEKCRSMPRCYRCGDSHTGDTCAIVPQEGTCCNCPQGLGGGHFATSKVCPEFGRQAAIKKTMADEHISYSEASSRHVRVLKKSYANVTGSFSPQGSSSYKKTTFRSPRSPPPSRKGYDKKAHEDIIKDPILPSKTVFTEKPSEQSNEVIINELIKILSSFVKFLSPSSPLANPSLLSHVAPLFSSLLFSASNGPSHNTVELP